MNTSRIPDRQLTKWIKVSEGVIELSKKLMPGMGVDLPEAVIAMSKRLLELEAHVELLEADKRLLLDDVMALQGFVPVLPSEKAQKV